MKIKVAEHAGFCFGVRRATRKIEEALKAGIKLYAIGEPIHNPQEVNRLVKLGLIVLKDAENVPDGATAFIRAHGVAPEVIAKLRKKNVKVVDGTCPFVKVVQKRANELSEKGYHVLILGESDHPEVKGIVGHIHGSFSVISSENQVLISTTNKNSAKIHKLGLVSQTTQSEEVFNAVLKRAQELPVDEFKSYNTICNATQERQEAVRQLAHNVDGMIVIGGKNSANTRRLRDIASSIGCPVQWIECASELDKSWLAGKETIGIAAGASTPDWIIQQLNDEIS